ncbi:hypothetical protein RASY3_08435 [Ruminococcus albus SY3]|uniref:Uncharacterized protein n=1 Tax=Ruminococcus albus SY3 TaxID=1341156 RepID=A0A011UDL2_RUMAL|nr:zinc ribbon domain-containing protein [Ruminococcus albus]EXM38714.1 hypothetical protein RASY3_18820 [Ruminococcus albus SY3]EXM40228.1 hypothetical protein RASY3_08435 [Ruminococcus albus SY3]
MSKFCQRCGTELPDDAQFCTKCGYNFSGNNNMVYTVPQGSSPLPVKKKGGCLKGLLIILGVLIGFIIIIMIAFGGDDKDKSKNNSSKATTTKQNNDSIETTSPLSDEPEEEETSAADKPAPKSGFNEETNIEVKNGGLIYHFPNYFKEVENKNNNERSFKYQEKDGSYVGHIVGYFAADNYFELNETNAQKAFDAIKETLKLSDDFKQGELRQDPILNRTEYEVGYNYKTNQEYAYVYIFLLDNPEHKYINYNISFYSYKNNELDYDYINDGDKIFYSIEEDKDYVYEKPTETKKDSSSKPDESSKSEKDDIEAIKKAVTNGDYSLVTPEFKETMDAYEAFMNEYYNFMDNYDTSTDLDYLNQYTELLQKEQEWIQKINAMDESKMTPADYAYYLLITSRITGKLLMY